MQALMPEVRFLFRLERFVCHLQYLLFLVKWNWANSQVRQANGNVICADVGVPGLVEDLRQRYYYCYTCFYQVADVPLFMMHLSLPSDVEEHL